MELILISNSKLKIMLNESDMRKYHIGNESDCAEATTRKAIRNLLECARDQIGFNTDGEEIFVQLYTSKHGGCELFVTKCLASAPAKDEIERVKSPIASDDAPRERKAKRQASLPENPLSDKASLDLSEKIAETVPKSREKRSSRIAFSFESFNDLLSVCKILDSAAIYPESRAYSDEDGNYYLLLLDTGMSAYSRLDKLTFILEYGKRENPDCLVSYISEHGRIICSEGAIERLCKF